MNATERAALGQGVAVYEDISGAIDERTFRILDRRRKTAIIRRRGWLVRRMLVLSDAVGLCLAFFAAQVLLGLDPGEGNRLDLWVEVSLFLATLPGWIVVAKLYGLYDRDEERTDHSTVDDFTGVFHMVTVGTWLLFAGARLTGVAEPNLGKTAAFWALATVLVPIGRSAARAWARRRITYLQNTVIVGAGDVGQLVARKVLNHPEYGINLIGLLDREPKERRDDLCDLTLLGPPERLPAIVRLFDVERVIIAFSKDGHHENLELVQSLKDLDVQIDIVPRLFELVGPNVALHTVEGLPLIGLPPLRLSRSALILKRSIDLLFALVGLLVLSPLLAYIAIRIKLDSPGPVFYRHDRIGKDGDPFRLLKFRTMRLEHCRGADYGGAQAELEFERLMQQPARRAEFEESYKFHDDPRVTRFGLFLRATSLDELPQLVNVLVGDISLVGPRPITLDELARYGRGADTLLTIRPGVTGYWQINGRSDLSYDERVRLDIAYIGSWSLKLDLMILAKTIRALFRRQGAF